MPVGTPVGRFGRLGEFIGRIAEPIGSAELAPNTVVDPKDLDLSTEGVSPEDLSASLAGDAAALAALTGEDAQPKPMGAYLRDEHFPEFVPLGPVETMIGDLAATIIGDHYLGALTTATIASWQGPRKLEFLEHAIAEMERAGIVEIAERNLRLSDLYMGHARALLESGQIDEIDVDANFWERLAKDYRGALKAAAEIDDIGIQAGATQSLVFVNLRLGNIEEAARASEEAYRLFLRWENIGGIAAYSMPYMLEEAQREFEPAAQQLFGDLEILTDRAGLDFALRSAALVYFQLGNLPKTAELLRLIAERLYSKERFGETIGIELKAIDLLLQVGDVAAASEIIVGSSSIIEKYASDLYGGDMENILQTALKIAEALEKTDVEAAIRFLNATSEKFAATEDYLQAAKAKIREADLLRKIGNTAAAAESYSTAHNLWRRTSTANVEETDEDFGYFAIYPDSLVGSMQAMEQALELYRQIGAPEWKIERVRRIYEGLRAQLEGGAPLISLQNGDYIAATPAVFDLYLQLKEMFPEVFAKMTEAERMQVVSILYADWEDGFWVEELGQPEEGRLLPTKLVQRRIEEYLNPGAPAEAAVSQ